MPTTKVNAIFDTYVDKTDRNSNFQTAGYMYLKQDSYISIVQFNLPVLNDANIVSAKLGFYVPIKGTYAESHAYLCDINTSLSGVTWNKYDAEVKPNEILEASGFVEWDSSVNSSYNRWVEMDITNLVVGHTGENYFTLSLKNVDTYSYKGTLNIRTSEAGYTPYIQIEYEYATPFKPKIVYPDGDSVSNAGNLTFSWVYQSGSPTPQAKFDLQWKMQSATAWNTITQATAATSYTMDAGAFTNGIVEWRVRTYNQNNMVSDWAESQFVVIGKPGNPVITGVKNDAITEITWSANKSEESAARLRIKKNGIVVYDSGVLPAGINDSHKVNDIFENGNYVALLSISNMYDMWSDEVSYSFSIGQAKPRSPVLTVSSSGDFAHLEFTEIAGAEYFIYRLDETEDKGFIPIGRTRANFYDDFAVMSNKRYQYFVRAYTGAYSDSEQKDVYIKYKGFYLSCVTDMEKRVNLFFHESENYLPFERKVSNNSVLVVYTGRKKPVRESGINKSQSLSIEAYVSKKNEMLIRDIYNQDGIFCIRSEDVLMYADISSIGETMTFFNRGYLLGMTFDEIYYQDRVRFDE